MTRPATRVLLAGAALVALAWMVRPLPAPPLFDGLIGPAEAYRYLNPPPGYQHTPAPSSASSPLTVSNGNVQAAFIATQEQPPQAQFLVGDGSMQAPPGATTVTLGLQPVPPPAPLPATLGTLVGNVYTVTARGDKGGDATVRAGGTPPTMVLRGPSGKHADTGHIVRFEPGGSWTELQTVPIGSGLQDMIAANTTALGDFGIAVRGGASGSSPGGAGGGSGGGSFPIVAVVLPLAALLLIALLLLAIRLNRRS